MKNPFKRNKKEAFPKNKVPRKQNELDQEYTGICAAIGQKQYQSKVLEQEILGLNRLLSELAKEANERQQLDAAVKASQAKTVAPVESSQQ